MAPTDPRTRHDRERRRSASGDGTLAGSAAGLDTAVRNLVSLGISLERAVRAVTTAPAAAIRRPDLGRLDVGGPADVTVLDDGLRVAQVLVGGMAA